MAKTRKASGRKMKRTRKMRGGHQFNSMDYAAADAAAAARAAAPPARPSFAPTTVIPRPTDEKPPSMQRTNKLREAVPEINKLYLVKMLIWKLWPAFTCTTPTITVQFTNIENIERRINEIINDLETSILENSSVTMAARNAAKSALSFLKSKTTLLGNIGKEQIASRDATKAFLKSLTLSGGKVVIPCEEAKTLAMRLVTFYDLNPLDYSGMNKSKKHAAANTRKAAREDLRALANYYKTNTNILNSFIKKYAIDEVGREEVKSALLVSMESNTNKKKVASIEQLVDELRKILAARKEERKVVESAGKPAPRSNGLSTGAKVYQGLSGVAGW